jgi:hypothetical protein
MGGFASAHSSGTRWTSFDTELAVCREEIEFSLNGYGQLPWEELLLNPRRLRGSDFLMRWSQGKWGEGQLSRAVRLTREFIPIPYGPSSTAPRGIREFELYFERLEAAGLGKLKRPDILLVRRQDARKANRLIRDLGGEKELPFTPESNRKLRSLLSLAVLAVECETSLWRSQQMPDFGRALRPMRRLGGRLGLPKSAILPTVIVKEEDRRPLRRWQTRNRIPLHVWHVFYDQAYGLSCLELDRLIRRKIVEPKIHTYQAPNGATTRKAIYKVPYLYGYELGSIRGQPQLRAASITDKNGHVLPYVRFSRGALRLAPEALLTIRGACRTLRRRARA